MVVDESGAGFVVCPAAALLGFGEFAVLHGLGSLGVCWWMCEGSNLMDQRVLAFVKVGLWLADCSPVESHPCCVVLLMLQCSSRCVVVSLRCCARVGLSCWLSLAAMQCSSRCFVASLSSACPCRSVLCSMSLLFVSRLLLLRCCLALMLLCCVRRRFSVECSSRCVVGLSGSRAPCCAPACRWCPALSRGRLWLGCGCGCRGCAGGLRLAPLGCSPSLRAV